MNDFSIQLYEDGKERCWTGPYREGQDQHRIIEPMKKKG
jgi:hypothetical protein